MGSGYTDRQERVVTWYERFCKARQVGDSNRIVLFIVPVTALVVAGI